MGRHFAGTLSSCQFYYKIIILNSQIDTNKNFVTVSALGIQILYYFRV